MGLSFFIKKEVMSLSRKQSGIILFYALFTPKAKHVLKCFAGMNQVVVIVENIFVRV